MIFLDLTFKYVNLAYKGKNIFLNIYFVTQHFKNKITV